MKNILKSKWIVLIGVIVGAFVLKNAIDNRQKATEKPVNKLEISARVIQSKLSSITPIVESYGEVKSAKIWQVLSELSGKISYVHPDLKSGYILDEGEILFKIDTSALNFKKEEFSAQIKVIESQLDQQNIEQTNLKKDLLLEKKQLKIDERELQRVQKLVEQKTSTESLLDAQTRVYLTRMQKIQSIENKINLYPSQRESLLAQLKVQNHRHSQVLEDIKKGVVKLPFKARLGKVALYENSYVNAYQILFEAHDVSKSEVHVQMSVAELKTILNFNESQLALKPGSRKFFESLKVKAIVRSASNHNFKWQGNVSRIKESLDAASRTVGVVIEVEQPYNPKMIASQPPLLHGMYVQVRLSTENRVSGCLVPTIALHNNEILIVDQDSKLRRQKVADFLPQRDWILLKDFKEGQLVIISDVKLGLDGVKVNYKIDQEVQNMIQLRAMEN
ncbi:MAG: hypothetical protein KC646_08285 [Candidatus Cloacimonetes bacterium]|nr:hypothetical protein [Candidatus Cloacimonadota bacterium]